MPVTKSPLRYPGGKTQLYNFVLNVIEANAIQDTTYIEPYAGGFGVGIELLINNQVSNVVINDYDKSIYSIWYSILYNKDKLIQLIRNTPITIDSWHEQKAIHKKYKNYRNSLENGFSTLFLNRTNRSGIISAGPIGGQKQNGKYKLNCRFNKEKIIDKIITISEYGDRISLYQKDAVKFVDVIKNEYSSKNTFCFFDPPYYVQGKNLYTNFYKHKDHQNLAYKICELNDYYWIITYDKSPQIQDIYKDFNNKFYYELRYSAQRKRKATEYIFASQNTKLSSTDKVILNPIS